MPTVTCTTTPRSLGGRSATSTTRMTCSTRSVRWITSTTRRMSSSSAASSALMPPGSCRARDTVARAAGRRSVSWTTLPKPWSSAAGASTGSSGGNGSSPPRPMCPANGASSGVCAVVQVDHAAAEMAYAAQFELPDDIVGKGRITAAHNNGREEQVALVDQPGPDRLSGEVGTAHGDVTSRRGLHFPDRVGVEVAFDLRPGTGCHIQRLGVNDLVGRLPDLGIVARDESLVGEGVRGFPGDHHLIHPTPVQVGADVPLEVVDEVVHL